MGPSFAAEGISSTWAIQSLASAEYSRSPSMLMTGSGA